MSHTDTNMLETHIKSFTFILQHYVEIKNEILSFENLSALRNNSNRVYNPHTIPQNT